MFRLLSSSFSFQLILLFNLALVDRSSRYIYVLSVRWMCNSVRSSLSKPLIIAPSHLDLQFCSILVMVRMCFNTTITIFQDFWGSLLYSNVRSIVCGSPLFCTASLGVVCVVKSICLYIITIWSVQHVPDCPGLCFLCGTYGDGSQNFKLYSLMSFVNLEKPCENHQHSLRYHQPLLRIKFFLYWDLFFIGTRKPFQAKTFAGQDMFLYTIWR